MNNFFSELKRRNVYKVAVAYIVGGWALSEGISQVFPVFDVPNAIIAFDRDPDDRGSSGCARPRLDARDNTRGD